MNQHEILPYNMVSIQYQQPADIIVDDHCNGYHVINIGTTVCFINKIPLNPGVPGVSNGESISFGGNRGEVFRGRIELEFAGGAGNAVVTQKVYITKEDY